VVRGEAQLRRVLDGELLDERVLGGRVQFADVHKEAANADVRAVLLEGQLCASLDLVFFFASGVEKSIAVAGRLPGLAIEFTRTDGWRLVSS